MGWRLFGGTPVGSIHFAAITAVIVLPERASRIEKDLT
jgi:hypothetical protein